MTTFPRNTVTGAPQNFLHRVSRKAACGPRSPGALGVSVSFSNLCGYGGGHHGEEAPNHGTPMGACLCLPVSSHWPLLSGSPYSLHPSQPPPFFLNFMLPSLLYHSGSHSVPSIVPSIFPTLCLSGPILSSPLSLLLLSFLTPSFLAPSIHFTTLPPLTGRPGCTGSSFPHPSCPAPADLPGPSSAGHPHCNTGKDIRSTQRRKY